MLFGIRWGNLYVKIIAWAFIPIVIILLTVALVMFAAYEQVAQNLVILRSQEVTHLSANQLTIILSEYIHQLDDVARVISVDSSAPISLERSHNKLSAFDEGVVILDNFGKVIATTPEKSEFLGQNWANRAYFSQLVLRSEPIFSDLVTNDTEKSAMIVLAIPITGDKGAFLGALVGMFAANISGSSIFYDDIKKLRLSEYGNIYVIDSRGQVIYHSNPATISDDFANQAVIQQALTRQNKAVRTRDGNGQDIVTGFAPIPDTSWNLVQEENWNTLTNPGQNYRFFLLALLALGVIIPAGVVALGARRITQPIQALTEAAQEVAKGNFSQKIKATTGDEIEKLADQFNLMSAQLQESYAQLEQHVADRTKELTALTKQFAILNAISTLVNESLELPHILNQVLNETLGLLNLEVGAIYLLDQDTGELVIQTHQGLSAESVRSARRCAPSWLLPEAALKSGEPLFEEDVLALPNRPLFQGEGLRSVAILPLRTRETLLGILELGTRRTIRHFSREGRELLRAISDQAAVAIENAQLYAETRRRVDEIETLFAIQQAITSRLDVPTVLQLIADEARRLTASRITVVFMLEDGELCVSVISSDEPVNVPIGYRMPVADSITAEAIKNGQPVRIDNIAAEPKAHIDLVKRLNIHALMILPLMSGAKVIGSISLIDKASGRFDSQDERVLNMLASSAVIGLENARLYQEEHTRRQEAEQRRQIAESLRDILTVLNSNRPVDEILEQIVAQAERLLGANAVAIYHLSGQEGTVRIQAAHGLLEEYMATMEFPVGEGLVRRAVTHRHPITVTDPNQLFQTNFQSLQQNPEHWSLFIEVIGRYRALLAVPLIIKNEVYGGIVLYYIQAPSFSEEEIGLAVSFADQVALAIENARLFDQAEQAAILEERQRLARELHDSVTQSLYGVTMFAEAATRLLNAGQVDLATGHLGELRSTAQEALQEMRLLLFELRPPVLEQEGLVAALQTRLEAVERRSGLATELKVSGPETLKLPAKIEDGLYRIAQEALNNALKHAQATQVKVQLSHDVQQVSLEISDNGCGFDPTTIRQRAGLGLRGIEERAKQLGAQLVIKSEPHYGTNIRVEVRL